MSSGSRAPSRLVLPVGGVGAMTTHIAAPQVEQAGRGCATESGKAHKAEDAVVPTVKPTPAVACNGGGC
jgi:hypothetical protein